MYTCSHVYPVLFRNSTLICEKLDNNSFGSAGRTKLFSLEKDIKMQVKKVKNTGLLLHLNS